MKEDALKWNERHSEGFMPKNPSDFLTQNTALIQAFLTFLSSHLETTPFSESSTTFPSHHPKSSPLDSEILRSTSESSPKSSSKLNLKRDRTPRPKALDLACGNGRNSRFLASLGFALESVDISHIALQSLHNTPHITPILADLDTYKLPHSCYHLFLQSFFLDRRLFEDIVNSLKAPALLLIETFVALSDTPSGLKNEKSDRILNEHELSATFSPNRGFHSIFSNIYHLERHNGTSEYVEQFIALFAPLDSEKSQIFENLAKTLRNLAAQRALKP